MTDPIPDANLLNRAAERLYLGPVVVDRRFQDAVAGLLKAVAYSGFDPYDASAVARVVLDEDGAL